MTYDFELLRMQSSVTWDVDVLLMLMLIIVNFIYGVNF